MLIISCQSSAMFRHSMIRMCYKKNIIELTHYGDIRVNKYAINELNIKVATLNKTLMMVIGETKFIKFTVVVMTDMRMTLARLTMGIMSLQENVNAIYKYI